MMRWINDFKHATLTFVFIAIGIILFFFPLDQIVPPFFQTWIPTFLDNISIFDFLLEHEDIIFSSGIIITLLAIILYLWRKH